MSFFKEVYAVAWSDIRFMRHNIINILISSLMLPVLYLLAFGYGLKAGDVDIFGDGSKMIPYLDFVIPGIIAVYKYSMAPYILMDHPEMTGGEAITASKNLMKGKKWKLFCVEFSFIGWCLLGALTFGIAYIWIGPYMQATMAAFYEDIKDEVGTTVAE